MPKVVDHTFRREEIARLAVRVIGQEGSEGATVRRIARAGGFSIGVLGHYFRNKDELVAFAFQWIATRTFADLRLAIAAAPPGLARLRTALEFMLPAPGADSFIEVWLSLWGRAVHNHALAGVHRRFYARWRRCLQRHLEEAVVCGQIALPRSVRDATDLLVSGIDGIWIGAAFEPRRFPAPRRRQLVERLLVAVLDRRGR
jgi:AcrR family transcriptional regulator